jgi:hypothetical protein
MFAVTAWAADPSMKGGDELAGLASVSDQDLAQARGTGMDDGKGNAQIVLGNSDSIGGGAFAGASGVITVIQNSGSNVLLQNATVVNITINK